LILSIPEVVNFPEWVVNQKWNERSMVAGIQDTKNKSGKDIFLFRSLSVCQALLKLNLIDEFYHLISGCIREWHSAF
jgi:hypothetical protein